MWRPTSTAVCRASTRPSIYASSTSSFLIAPAHSQLAVPMRFYAGKVEAEEFESDIAPELVSKFDDAKVGPDQRKKVINAPAHLPGKAGVLAMRLFENASAFNQLDAVAEDLNKLRRLALKNEDFDNFLRDKSFQKSQQHTVFDSILGKSPRTLQRFIALNVVEDANVSRLLKLVDNFNELMSVHRKEVDVHISVAEQWDNRKLNNLKDEILAKLPKGSNPNWKVEVRPDILGGYVVDAGEHFNLDKSVASQQAEVKRRVGLILNKMRARLAVEPPEDVPRISSADLDRMSRGRNIPSASEVEASRKRAEDAKKADLASQQAAFKRSFLEWV